MKDAISNFNEQFSWDPEVIGLDGRSFGRFMVAGMGGSHLAADVMKAWDPNLDLEVHWDYDLPSKSESFFEDRLLIASSYSGNTEETVSAFESALEKRYPVSVLTTGGKLLELAKKNSVPYVQVPDTGIQPRAALGYMFRGLAALMLRKDALESSSKLSESLNPKELIENGREMANNMKGKVPVIYSSNRNWAVAYNWKIKFNETGKIPAFCNVFPELNHNEMTGFDAKAGSRDLAERFHFIFLYDTEDDERVQKRMRILERQLNDRSIPVIANRMTGNRLEAMFSSLSLADWAAYFTAAQYREESEQVPMVEEFKGKMNDKSQ